jgi:hypothetical protein
VPGIQGGDQALDGAALAGGVPALEDHAERRPDLVLPELTAEQQPQPQQPLLSVLQPMLGLLGGQLDRRGGGSQATHGPSLAPGCDSGIPKPGVSASAGCATICG